jgi:hypothetical protein
VKREAATYTTAEAFALLIAADKGEYCLSACTRSWRVLDSENQAAALAGQIRTGRPQADTRGRSAVVTEPRRPCSGPFLCAPSPSSATRAPKYRTR